MQDENQGLKEKIRLLEKKLIDFTDGRSSKMPMDYPKKSSRYVRNREIKTFVIFNYAVLNLQILKFI